MMRTINELLFWLHLALLGGAVISGLFLPLPIIIFLIVLHRSHVWLFGGCILSKFQEKLGGIPTNRNFIQVVAKKMFDANINQAQSHFVDYLLVLSTFTLASTNHLVRIIS